ncbi:MAG: cytochrome c-type biogenesis protein [Gammaproteobacteria bacterium]
MRQIISVILLSMFCIVTAWAQAPVFSDPVAEKRYESFTHGLRCLKCEHQSVAESDSDFSKDVKTWVAQAITDGRSDQEIKDMLQDRFGDRIFLNPPWQMNTYVLWFAPLLLCLLGLVIWIRRVRK